MAATIARADSPEFAPYCQRPATPFDAEDAPAVVTSAPFLVIIAGLAVSFWREILGDRRAAERALAERARALEAAATVPAQTPAPEPSAARER